MDDIVKRLNALPPIEPTITITEIKKLLYNQVKKLDNIQHIAPQFLIIHQVGVLGGLTEVYELMATRKLNSDEVRSWKNEFENIQPNSGKPKR